MFANYYQVRDWLESFIPQTYTKRELGLERIKYLLKLLGNPQNRFKSILIAGTSGKGSTAFYIARLLKFAGPVSRDTRGPVTTFPPAFAKASAGKPASDNSAAVSLEAKRSGIGIPSRTATRSMSNVNGQLSNVKIGLHISPHLVDIRERMQILQVPVTRYQLPGTSLVSMRRFLKLFNEIRPIVKKIKKDKPDLTPSYFEILVAASFKYFADEKVDWAVVEVGLGGRLDATNVLEPELAVITNVGLDHTDILGKTEEKIAFEKAGIIKEGIPVVTGCPSTHFVRSGSLNLHNSSGSSRKALEVIEKVAREKKAPLIKIDTQVATEHLRSDIKDYLIIYRDILRDKKVFVTEDVFLLSINSLLSLGIYPTRSGIIEAFSSPFAGRFEEIKPGVILDGAHNLEKMRTLVHFLKNQKPETRNQKLILVVAFKKGKDWQKMVDLLIKNLPITRVIATQFYAVTDTGFFAAVEPEEIRQYLMSNVKCQMSNVKTYDNSQEAVFNALNTTQLPNYQTTQLILVTGSLYLVGEVRTIWKLPNF